MIPYKSSFATAVPPNPEVWHEIFKAARTLAKEDELVRQRREETASIRNELEVIQKDIAELRRDGRSLILAELRKYGYNPQEPRVPKHEPGGGEWTHVSANDDPNEVSSDVWFRAQPYAEGHHWVPKTVYQKRRFSSEVVEVFDKSRSGPLANPTVNYNSSEHRQYNVAVNELLDAFLDKMKITDQTMTPSQAEEFVQEVKGASDPRIRQFITKINREVLRYNLRYGPGRRGGGGDEE